MLVQRRRDAKAAKKLLRRLLKNAGVRPEAIVTDNLRSYPRAMREAGLADRLRPSGIQQNNGLKTPIRPFDDESESSRISNPKAPPSASSPPILRTFRARAFEERAVASKAALEIASAACAAARTSWRVGAGPSCEQFTFVHR